jgi:type I restriction enzyme S subunit
MPPISEQSQIAKFLDYKTRQIDDLIEKKQNLIELLIEERSALINQAVIKGLDQTVPMKDSGIEWLGEIPEHWEQRKLKFIAECNTSNVDKHSKDDEKIVSLCNYTDVYKNDLIQSGMNFMSATASLSEIENFTLKEDDVLITKDSETPDDIAIPAYVTKNLFNVICGYHLAMIRSNKDLLYGKYLFYLFKSYKFNQQFTIAANGITRFGLGISTIRNSVISIPSKSEQLKIVKFLDQKFKIVEKSAIQIEKEIELLHEYKTSLINEAVTGKIDVRDYQINHA